MNAFDIPCLEQAGFEADDIIATYARLACEAKATATIVSSDKDLMQLVNDCVTMYDTMKDKRIGLAEVIEKFGVPPEKVIEVQALIGDSTDNVPGVPGIGVKTAAQLISEYGDLETLLTRAGEIKQDKRRQTLIDNAELARISKRLVTLDQNVELEVPVEDLAVHEPDYKHLIAFLKAMEFSTLTRRVAEKSGIEANEIEADAKLTSGDASRRRCFARRPRQRRDRAYGRSGDLFAPPPQPRSKAEDQRRPLARRARRRRISPPRRRDKIDRSKYETVRTLDRLKAWVAARQGHRRRRDRHQDHQPRSDDGAAVRLLARGRRQRSLLRAARPPRRRHAGRQRPVRAGGQALRRTRFRRRRRSRRSSRCWKTRACSRSART